MDLVFQVSRCTKWMPEVCADTFDKMNCMAASSFCEMEIAGPFMATGKLCFYDA